MKTIEQQPEVKYKEKEEEVEEGRRKKKDYLSRLGRIPAPYLLFIDPFHKSDATD